MADDLSSSWNAQRRRDLSADALASHATALSLRRAEADDHAIPGRWERHHAHHSSVIDQWNATHIAFSHQPKRVRAAVGRG